MKTATATRKTRQKSGRRTTHARTRERTTDKSKRRTNKPQILTRCCWQEGTRAFLPPPWTSDRRHDPGMTKPTLPVAGHRPPLLSPPRACLLEWSAIPPLLHHHQYCGIGCFPCGALPRPRRAGAVRAPPFAGLAAPLSRARFCPFPPSFRTSGRDTP